jgi:hypothetical protein
MAAQCSWGGTASECLQPLEAGVVARPVHLFLQRQDGSLPRCCFVDDDDHQCEAIAGRETRRCPQHRYGIV